MGQIEKDILKEVHSYQTTLSGLHGNFLDSVTRDLSRFEKETSNVSNQMKWQAKLTLGLASFAALFAVAGTLIPKADGTTTPLSSRLNASGAQDVIKSILDKCKDNEFLRSTSKTVAKFLNGISPAVDTYCRSQTTELESKRDVLRSINIQKGQEKQSEIVGLSREVQQALSRIFDTTANG